jgi:hypothetical protein
MRRRLIDNSMLVGECSTRGQYVEEPFYNDIIAALPE